MRDQRKKSPDANLINLSAEKIILGKVLTDETIFWDIAQTVHEFHFSREIHQKIYSAIRAICYDGKRATLSMIISRIGPEYDDGASVMTLMTALMRDADEIEEINHEISLLIESWQRRRVLELADYYSKEARRADVDTGYMLQDMENAIKDVSVNSQAEPLKTLGQAVSTAIRKSAKASETGQSPGFDTGLSSLDEILGRIHGGDLGIIGARQGDAKTVLGVQLARRCDEFGIPSAIFELEMRSEDIGRRVLAGETSASVSQIEEGSYGMYEMEELVAAEELLKNSKVYIDDRPKLRIDQIRDRCVALKRSKGLGLIVIDHLRLVRATGKFKDKFDRTEYITGEAKAFAKELDIAVIFLSQLTRMSQRRDEPSPQISDMDGSSSIEQDADWVLGMFRRDRWLKTTMPRGDLQMTQEGRDWSKEYNDAKGKIEIRCLKRRRGEDGEMRQFEFHGKRGVITEIQK
jgi:replicative DNA helicase